MTEPIGCPTPGACSCPPVTKPSERDREMYRAALNKAHADYMALPYDSRRIIGEFYEVEFSAAIAAAREEGWREERVRLAYVIGKILILKDTERDV